MSDHLYLSPHLDDAIFSCGGLIARQAAEGQSVTVLTICAGDPPAAALSELALQLHAVWEQQADPVGTRRAEDLAACRQLGVRAVHLPIPDAIYRSGEALHLYPEYADLYRRLHEGDLALVEEVAEVINAHCQAQTQLYVPLAVGGHVDHRLTRKAAEQAGRDRWYYQDLPYASQGWPLPDELAPPEGTERIIPLSTEELELWMEAIRAYRSQLSSFWPDEHSLRQELQHFHAQQGGLRLLKVA